MILNDTDQPRKPSYAEIAKTPPAKRRHESGQNAETSCVKVVVRVRPDNEREKDGNFENVVRVMNENVLVFDPQESSSPRYGYRNRRRRDITVRIKKDLKFAFDYVFGPQSNNSEVYQQTTKKILGQLLDGYNCSGNHENSQPALGWILLIQGNHENSRPTLGWI